MDKEVTTKRSRCQNATQAPEHAFSYNTANKVNNFGFMTLEEALKPEPVATAKYIDTTVSQSVITTYL